MNILFCGSLDLSVNTAAFTTISFFKRSLENDNHKVYILGSGKDKDFKKNSILEQGDKFIYKPILFKRYLPKAFQIIQNDKKQISAHLPKIIKEKSINLIITYSTFYPVLEKIIKIAKSNRIKCITYGGEYFSVNFKNSINTTNYYQFLAKKFSFKKFNGHICSTKYHYETLKKLNSRSIVIPTIAPEIIQFEDFPNNSDYQKFRLVWMGKPIHREYLLQIIKATKLAQSQGFQISLCLISEINSKKGSLVNKIKKEIKFSKNIFVTGFLTEKEKSRILNKASAFIHLRDKSRETAHAFPTRLPEYLAYQKPLILSYCSPFTDYFIHLKNAYFIEHRNNIIDIKKAIIELYNNHKLCNYIGENCKDLINKNFSFKINGNKLNNFIKYYE